LGGITGILVYSWKKKFDFREIGDMFAASIPLGYTFGRIGNFINGELFGRITSGPLGMVFPAGGIYPNDKQYTPILEGARRMGFSVLPRPDGFFNLPRHPSQLYEAFFEGIFLWAVIWFWRSRKPFKGFLITLYLSGYGLIRFILEYFREPDASLGYRIQFVPSSLPPALGHPLLSFSTGQILSFGMILLGIVWALAAFRMKDREPLRVYPTGEEAASPDQAEKAAGRNKRRKLRKKLR
jgi:phosphatidylglycerol:prolipoprotein diacylglycerol transferase